MALEKITDELIRQDIANFNKRIAAAQAKLSELPLTAPSWKLRKKLGAKRRDLEAEIVHVNHLIDIATKALEASINS